MDSVVDFSISSIYGCFSCLHNLAVGINIDALIQGRHDHTTITIIHPLNMAKSTQSLHFWDYIYL